MKKCTKCSQEKELNEFQKIKTYYRNICRNCRTFLSKEANLIRVKRWYKNNPEKAKINARLQDGRRRTAEKNGELSIEQWEDILYLYNYKCIYCNDNWEQIDHVVPISKNGEHAYWNVVPACKRCNLKKGNRL